MGREGKGNKGKGRLGWLCLQISKCGVPRARASAKPYRIISYGITFKLGKYQGRENATTRINRNLTTWKTRLDTSYQSALVFKRVPSLPDLSYLTMMLMFVSNGCK
jgi:hypothetical protein